MDISGLEVCVRISGTVRLRVDNDGEFDDVTDNTKPLRCAIPV